MSKCHQLELNKELACIVFLQLHIFFNLDSNKLLELTSTRRDAHFFLDETPFKSTLFTVSILEEISKTLSPESYLWVACQGDNEPNILQLQGKSRKFLGP